MPVADGPVAYAKAGARNAMARAVAGVVVALHPAARGGSACAVGVAPTAIRPDARRGVLIARRGTASATRTPRAASARSSPRRDRPERRTRAAGRAYRRHVTCVLARRALTRAVAAL